MLYSNMLSESQRLETKIQALQKELALLPEGKLFCVRDGKRIKWFRKENNTELYIPKKNRTMAEQLAYKKYLSLLLDKYVHEKRAIDFYLRHHDKHMGEALQNLIENPAYQELLVSRQISEESDAWVKEPYQKNTSYPEQLVYKTVSGNIVRSKSEVLIDMYLYTNKIPFRYECALTLGEVTMYPDFTIRHPITGEIYYLEHFGMIDNPEYSRKAFAKMQLYAEHQIYPGHQLITTFESRKKPLTLDTIESIMNQYLL